jgi:hypothetical protein
MGGNHGRYSLGLQVGHFVGLEAGWTMREASGAFATSHGLHIAPFLSGGILTLAMRASFLEAGSGPTYGTDLAFVLGIKLPIPGISDGEPAIHNWRGFGYSRSGRPLRDGCGRPILARARSCGQRSARRRRPDRARAWLADARAEHASVPAFLELAAQLASLDAPPSLVARSIQAAREEVEHARSCLDLASRWSGERYELDPLPPLEPRCRSRRDLAASSIVDGCFAEGHAAALACEAAKATDDEDEARALSVIARDEASHAALARDVAVWADPDLEIPLVGIDTAIDPSSTFGRLVSARRARDLGDEIVATLQRT